MTDRRIALEGHRNAFDVAVPFDVDPLRTVDHHLGHGGVA